MTELIETRYERFERAAELPMLVLSVAFLGAVVVPEVVTLSDGAAALVELIEYLVWGAFAAEVLILFVLASSKRMMLRSHWLDVLIVLAPFLRPLRLARLARVVRASSGLGRVLAAIGRVTSRRGFQAYTAVTILVIAASGILVWAFERDEPEANIQSIADGLWWAVATASTVGYGDEFPVSAPGRGVAVLVMVIGIGLLGVVTANVAAVFVSEETEGELADVREQLARIEALLEAQAVR